MFNQKEHDRREEKKKQNLFFVSFFLFFFLFWINNTCLESDHYTAAIICNIWYADKRRKWSFSFMFEKGETQSWPIKVVNILFDRWNSSHRYCCCWFSTVDRPEEPIDSTKSSILFFYIYPLDDTNEQLINISPYFQKEKKVYFLKFRKKFRCPFPSFSVKENVLEIGDEAQEERAWGRTAEERRRRRKRRKYGRVPQVKFVVKSVGWKKFCDRTLAWLSSMSLPKKKSPLSHLFSQCPWNLSQQFFFPSLIP